ncbi:hypothetical protein BZA77DRAFT_343282 [Pyronema omphalodes]|nr:hypothetical protein BZA77DRAFT_343282 [Pyronema omphalodes]
MVLFSFGSVIDFINRNINRIFRRKSQATIGWHQMDVERGGVWGQPESPMSRNSVADMSKSSETWGNARGWDDLRRDQEALSRERDNLNAEKAAWQLECLRIKEEQKALEKERQRFKEDKALFFTEREKWNKEKQAQAKSRKDLENILKSFIKKSQQNTEVIANLRRGIEMRQMINNPTPPASPKVEKMSAATYLPSYESEKRRIGPRVQTAMVA